MPGLSRNEPRGLGFVTILSGIESLRGGREPLELLLRQGKPLAGADLRLILSRLNREVAQRSGDLPTPEARTFFTSTVRALGKLRDSSNVTARIECLFGCAIFFYNNGDNEQGLAVAKLLDDLARRTDSPYWARRIAMYGGVVHADLGNVAEAIVRQSAALEISRRANDVAGEISVLCNLGAALIYGGLYNEAIPCLRRAVALSQVNRGLVAAIATDKDPAHFESIALTNLSQCYYLLGDKRRALGLISDALRLSNISNHPLATTSLVLREATFIQVAIELGMREEAFEHLQSCNKYLPNAGLRARLVAELSQGRFEVASGNSEFGFRILEGLLEKSGDITSLRMSVLQALATTYDELDQPDRALAYIDELIEIIRVARSKAINSLLATPRAELVSEPADLHALQIAQARIRARAAEHEAEQAHIDTLERLAIAADVKEEASGGHGHRVGRLASLFAKEIGWSLEASSSLELAGRLHDIGKISLPDRIMLKPSTLKEAERHFVAAHTQIGAEILAKGGAGTLRMAQEVARFHHEHWNGEGYPHGLAGLQIPLAARIVTLADAFDAMTHGRPYGQLRSIKDALSEISKGLGTQFDPELGGRFVQFVDELLHAHADLDLYLGETTQTTMFTIARKRIRHLLDEARPADEIYLDGDLSR